MADDSASPIAGPNAWLVDEMFEQFRSDPSSVSESWREFFGDYSPGASTTAAAPPVASAPAPTQAAPTAAPSPTALVSQAPPVTNDAPIGTPLRGAAARIVSNMEASLNVPTATSFREIPTKLLEVNRKSINGYLSRSRSG
ncbi:MAG: hypothetical protein QNL59_11860 [Actinomycetota bacterium]